MKPLTWKEKCERLAKLDGESRASWALRVKELEATCEGLQGMVTGHSAETSRLTKALAKAQRALATRICELNEWRCDYEQQVEWREQDSAKSVRAVMDLEAALAEAQAQKADVENENRHVKNALRQNLKEADELVRDVQTLRDEAVIRAELAEAHIARMEGKK